MQAPVPPEEDIEADAEEDHVKAVEERFELERRKRKGKGRERGHMRKRSWERVWWDWEILTMTAPM